MHDARDSEDTRLLEDGRVLAARGELLRREAAAYMCAPTLMQAEVEPAPISPAEPAAEEPDEVDRLFTAGT